VALFGAARMLRSYHPAKSLGFEVSSRTTAMSSLACRARALRSICLTSPRWMKFPLKEAIYDGRLLCYYVPKLEEELLGLQYDAKPFSRWIWRFASALPSVQSCDIVRNITTLERAMEKAVSAADANRKFSKLLRTIREGHSYVVTSHGKAVAKIVPVEKNSTLTPGARSALLKRLRSEPIVTIGRWKRDELYEDEP
jgi:prevent-host-death family protein